LGDERISAPGLDTLRTAIWQDVAIMVEAVKTGDPTEGGLVSGRLYTLKGDDTPESSDTAEAAEIAKLRNSPTATARIGWSRTCARRPPPAATRHDFDLGQIQIFFAR
jgi:hypothetical protein